MSAWQVILAIGLGLIVNEMTNVSPWLARVLVAWSARLRYGDTARAEIRSEELAAVVNDRPGNLFKLGTALRFVATAIIVRVRRSLLGRTAEQDAQRQSDSIPDFIPTPEPSDFVRQYLYPTEKFRGEWRRHWMDPLKAILLIAIYAVLIIWAAQVRLDSGYYALIAMAVIPASTVLACWRILAWWHFSRFVLSNKRLMSTKGILFRRVGMLPLVRVVDLRYTQSPLARVLNYGTFRMQSAGRLTGMRKFTHMPNPNDLYLRIVEEMYEPEAYESRRSGYRYREPGFQAYEGMQSHDSGDYDYVEYPDPTVAEHDQDRASTHSDPRAPILAASDSTEVDQVLGADLETVPSQLVDSIDALVTKIGDLVETLQAKEGTVPTASPQQPPEAGTA